MLYLFILYLWIFQALYEEVIAKQTEFDGLTEHAQILLQSTTDNRVTSQLTQMSSRYTSLIAMSKVSLIFIVTNNVKRITEAVFDL